MAELSAKLTRMETQGLLAFSHLARQVREPGQTLELNVEHLLTGVGPDDVVLVVLSTKNALVTRTHVRGRVPDVGALHALLMGADVAAEQLSRRTSTTPIPPLGRDEAALLDAAGLVDSTHDVDPLERTRVELELMLRQAATLKDAARELKVSSGRLRQRLSKERSLYGMKDGRAWRIPRFQFAKKGRLVRNIDQVLPNISSEAHPLSVHTWFTSPHQDLVAGIDQRPVTPIAWLEAGNDPTVVAKLAIEL